MKNTNKRKHKFNPLYQNFLSLKINPLNNNKFLKWKSEFEYKKTWCRSCKKKIETPTLKWLLTKNSSKKKWEDYLNSQMRSQTFFNRFKLYTINTYKANKFASQGNSYKKRFKNKLLAKTAFSFVYGGLSKKYLKSRMAGIYTHKDTKNYKNSCMEYFESRLDSALYRSKFCISVRNARQLITHEHVEVNGLVEKNKDYALKKGDIITLTGKSKKLVKRNIKEKFEKCSDFIWPIPPKYLNINYGTLEIMMGNIKNFDFSSSFPFKLDIHSIVKSNYRY